MRNSSLKCTILSVFLSFVLHMYAQIPIEPNDPKNNPDIPAYFKSKLTDIEDELTHIKKGNVKLITESAGGLPVYAVFYGEKDNFHSQANYNSAIGARTPSFYAKKIKETKPVVFFLGPVHGQEVEGIAGLVNLIHIAETGKDHRGKKWPELKRYFEQCRVIIIPCGNPDGRKRCPYDSFVGLPVEIVIKYGQGTHKNGVSWGWPQAKSLHPMKGDVGILGAYFNDQGINMMHNDFFMHMAEETKAILKIARDEAPDMTVSLHSYTLPPSVLQAAYVPFFMKSRIADFANKLNEKYRQLRLPCMPENWERKVTIDDEKFPPQTSFNLVSALHHISGTMSFTFECPYGTTGGKMKMPPVDYNTILDIQLNLYHEMFSYLVENRLYWE
ncbi:MAG: M14 family zinc carboxypeptidase [Mangrovibacterium sp.]